MRTEAGIKIRKNARIHFPYCGYKTGFCTSNDKCKFHQVNGKGCRFFRKYHPVTNEVPQSLV